MATNLISGSTRRRAGARAAAARLRRLLPAVFVVASACACAAAAQQPPPGKFKVSRIEWAGLQRMKEEELIAASGLRAGQEADVAALDAAAERLMASGLVTRVEYRLRESNGSATVTFDVVEAKRDADIPVTFDNFVWFTRDELIAAVRKHLPAFDGKAPELNSAVAGITRALESLLAERKIAGEVDYLPQASIAGSEAKHIFSVRGVSLPVCAVRFPGASAITEGELAGHARQVLGTDYSQELMSEFAGSAIRLAYQQRGHLKVSFGEPAAALDAAPACKGGVAVSVAVAEGPAYAWGGAAWSGNTALTPAELDAALALKPGELANVTKIERAQRQAREAYGRKGYIAARWRERREFSEGDRRVVYRFDVTEGPQYRMGALGLTGLSDADAARARAQWRLKPGDVYDDAQPRDFVQRVMPMLHKPGEKPWRVETNVRPDAQKLTADVTINFKRE
ncbi:MAG: hypothetical protein LC800_06520 [Acidobacteria bacterium]|nr:hypothetical protein [Acidobacteriota bacterium]